MIKNHLKKVIQRSNTPLKQSIMVYYGSKDNNRSEICFICSERGDACLRRGSKFCRRYGMVITTLKQLNSQIEEGSYVCSKCVHRVQKQNDSNGPSTDISNDFSNESEITINESGIEMSKF